MVLALCVLTLLGFPVAFTLAGTALIFAGIGMALGLFDGALLGFFPSRIFGVMTNEVLLAVPLFVFMGVMLERSKVSEDLLESMSTLFGNRSGGIGFSVIIVGTLLAASTGIVGATVIAMGLLSLPTMLGHGYDPKLASGTIAASGTLGQIIPPSIVLVVLGDQLSNAHQEAGRLTGNWALEPVTVGDLFAGALIPGLALVSLYFCYLLAKSWVAPETCPAVSKIKKFDTDKKQQIHQLLHALIAPILLIIAVLGSILAGIATPTEAAGIGAVGATMLAAHRFDRQRPFWHYAAGLSVILLFFLNQNLDLRFGRDQVSIADRSGMVIAVLLCAMLVIGLAVALKRCHRHGVLADVMRRTTRISAMVFMIVIGAQLFSLVFRGFGGDARIHDLLTTMPGGEAGAMVTVMVILFVLGFFLDFIEITFLVVPIIAPILLQLGFDPVWLGVMIALNLQTSFLTPPFGLALFYLRSVAPPAVSTMQIYRGIVPFVALQLLMLFLLSLMPAMATWLPSIMRG